MSAAVQQAADFGGSSATGRSRPTFTCQTCVRQGKEPKSYSRIEYLHRHERQKHFEDKRYKCDGCGKSYARSDVLYRHRRACPAAKSREGSSEGDNAQDATPAVEEITDLFGSNDDGNDGNGSSPSSSGSPASIVAQASSREPRVVTISPDFDAQAILDGLITDGVIGGFDNDGLATIASEASKDWSTGATLDPYTWDQAAKRYRGHRAFFIPEKRMINSQIDMSKERCGKQTVMPSNPFYFDPGKFMYCYMFPRWEMPSAVKMSALAYRSYSTLLGHLDIFHTPTFNLNSMHNWVIFAICTTPFSPASDLRPAQITDVTGELGKSPEISDALKEIDKDPTWDQTQSTIRREKTDLLIRNFYQTARGKKMTAEESLPLIHALLLYNSVSFLSEDNSERLAGEMYLATIVAIARQSGVFQPGQEGVLYSQSVPSMDLDDTWKKWIKYESWRRTAWLVYTLDTIASLEQHANVHVPVKDVRHIPLPYPDKVWKAQTAQEWMTSMQAHDLAGMVIDTMFTCLARSSEEACVDPETGAMANFHRKQSGPFTRYILIQTILRGLIDYGRGKPNGGYVTKRWILGRKGAEVPPKEQPIARHNFIIHAYRTMFDNFRSFWDLDRSCHETSDRSTAVAFVNDALPMFWLGQRILGELQEPPPAFCSRGGNSADSEDEADDEDGPDRLRDLPLKKIFMFARHFVKSGEGKGQNATGPCGSSPSTVFSSPCSSTISQIPSQQSQQAFSTPQSLQESSPPQFYPMMNSAAAELAQMHMPMPMPPTDLSSAARHPEAAPELFGFSFHDPMVGYNARMNSQATTQLMF